MIVIKRKIHPFATLVLSFRTATDNTPVLLEHPKGKNDSHINATVSPFSEM